VSVLAADQDNATPMDDKFKNKMLITTLAACWSFMLWWWLISSGGFLGFVVSIFVGAIVGVGAWFAVDFLS